MVATGYGMVELYTKVKKKLSSTKDSAQPQTMKSGRGKDGRFLSGKWHPKGINFAERQKELALLQLRSLTLDVTTLSRNKGGYWNVSGACSVCGKTKWYDTANLLSGRSQGCRCNLPHKYNSQHAEMLGDRYACMVQRCERESHKSWRDYKGRGIKVLFTSTEHFIRWALHKWPDTDFKGLDFDRIDNNGHYEPENLRLVTRSANLRNRRAYKKRASTTS
jgi:hypothetical protein